MDDRKKTKAQLIGELEELRNQISELTISDQRVTMAIEGTDEGVWDWDVANGDIYFDKEGLWLRILGYEKDEIDFNFDWWEKSVHPESFPCFEKALNDYLSGKEKYYEIEYRIKTKSGDWKWIWARGIGIEFDKKRKPLRMIGTHRDITDKKKIKIKLIESEKRLKEAQSIGKIGDWEFDIINQKIMWSYQVYELYERDPSLGPPTVEEEGEYYSPEQTEMLHNLARQAIEEGKEFNYYITANLPSGKNIWLSANMKPIKEKNGRVIKLIGTVQDITDRKKAEEEVRSLAEFPGENPNPVLRISKDGVLLFINKAALYVLDTLGLEIGKTLPDEPLKNFLEATKDNKVNSVDLPVGDQIHNIVFAPTGDYVNAYGRNVTEHKQAEEALRESERKYRNLIENNPYGIQQIDTSGIILYTNQTYQKMLGHTEKELLGESILNLLEPVSQREGLRDYLAVLVKEKPQPTPYLQQNRIKNGRVIDVVVDWNYDFDNKGHVVGFTSIITDITERKKAEEVLNHSHDLMRYIIEHNRSAIAVHDRDLKYVFVSQRYLDDYKVKERDVIGMHHYDVFPDLPQKWRDVHQKALAGEVSSAEDDPYIREDGSVDWTRWECRPWFEVDGSIGGIIIYTEVITERKKAEEQIKASLKEKEVLLREIHHRVKNNLQVIASLLKLQAFRTENPEYQKLLKESVNRIQTMGLIHNLLYKSGNFKLIDFNEYINKLCDNLKSLFMVTIGDITITTDIQDVFMELDSAIPCGLIVNELISNSMKHAFPDFRTGEIGISMKSKVNDTIELIVEDNGIGIPESFDWENTESLGLNIVNLLVRQLDGGIELIRNNGTLFRITLTG